ncbi:hypothetical protein BGZ80_004537 [Entomortierella chlamydospora]|uniref:BHLH domain-containing protein n=1 Tax=Entomortierella chlamydospora TaxID=101097 RepID=A0A9P6MZZ8_9FUNG|nr:hypothetical protein BGZ80_004537 [Entomortierella chlamydospora]
MSGFNDIEQRRSSYPARHELVHQGHGSVPQALDSAMDVYGHQRTTDLHHVSRPGPVSATARILHKSSTREVAAVGPNRRLAHILSEQKRREKINGGFDELKSVVPE